MSASIECLMKAADYRSAIPARSGEARAMPGWMALQIWCDSL
jgi:hypothetical protein